MNLDKGVGDVSPAVHTEFTSRCHRTLKKWSSTLCEKSRFRGIKQLNLVFLFSLLGFAACAGATEVAAPPLTPAEPSEGNSVFSDLQIALGVSRQGGTGAYRVRVRVTYVSNTPMWTPRRRRRIDRLGADACVQIPQGLSVRFAGVTLVREEAETAGASPLEAALEDRPVGSCSAPLFVGEVAADDMPPYRSGDRGEHDVLELDLEGQHAEAWVTFAFVPRGWRFPDSVRIGEQIAVGWSVGSDRLTGPLRGPIVRANLQPTGGEASVVSVERVMPILNFDVSTMGFVFSMPDLRPGQVTFSATTPAHLLDVGRCDFGFCEATSRIQSAQRSTEVLRAQPSAQVVEAAAAGAGAHLTAGERARLRQANDAE